MRLFIAIDMNLSMKDELTYIANQIKTHAERCSLTNYDNLHLTLAFIGESDKKDKIISELSKVKFSAFELKLSELGYFSQKGEKLIYAALEKNDALTTLQKNISDALDNSGINFDKKKFVPHITIARRVKGLEGEYIKSIRAEKITSPVNEFYLYASDLSGKRPTYTKLATFR